MSAGPFGYSESLQIAIVDFVSPDEVKVVLDIEAPESVALNAGGPRPFPRVNSYVLIPVDDSYLVGQIEWVGRRRSQATLRRGLKALGPEVVKGLRFVCSDMWKPYLQVIAAQVGQALHVLDRFHITSHLNQAVDQVRRAESTRLRAKSKKAAQRLKHQRWPLLRRGSRVRGRARQKLNALLASKLATARAWDLKETFSHFWKYKSVIWAGGFLDYWCFRAMRSRLEPMKKVARMLRAHEPLILNWFRAKGEISNGAVEGLNNKIRVITRRSYGFRTFEAMEIALYHNLGRLPEPESPHRFC